MMMVMTIRRNWLIGEVVSHKLENEERNDTTEARIFHLEVEKISLLIDCVEREWMTENDKNEKDEVKMTRNDKNNEVGMTENDEKDVVGMTENDLRNAIKNDEDRKREREETDKRIQPHISPPRDKKLLEGEEKEKKRGKDEKEKEKEEIERGRKAQTH